MDMDANVVDLERRKRHSHILKQLPGHFIAKVSTLKRKRYPASSKDGTSVLLTDPWKTVQTTVSSKSSKDGASIEEVKETISLLLQLPSSLSNLNSTGCDDLLSDVKFLLWLMPRVLSSPSSAIHSGRNILMLPRNVDNKVCDVGEDFLLSSLKRSKLKEQMQYCVDHPEGDYQAFQSESSG
ncbi:mediator of RNA polymerase II transcription subunit [Trifolium repens]|nr:mediator of RNA polymerase II transcription subunit [Trifolium repens]